MMPTDRVTSVLLPLEAALTTALESCAAPKYAEGCGDCTPEPTSRDFIVTPVPGVSTMVLSAANAGDVISAWAISADESSSAVRRFMGQVLSSTLPRIGCCIDRLNRASWSK